MLHLLEGIQIEVVLYRWRAAFIEGPTTPLPFGGEGASPDWAVRWSPRVLNFPVCQRGTSTPEHLLFALER